MEIYGRIKIENFIANCVCGETICEHIYYFIKLQTLLITHRFAKKKFAAKKYKADDHFLKKIPHCTHFCLHFCFRKFQKKKVYNC